MVRVMTHLLEVYAAHGTAPEESLKLERSRSQVGQIELT